MIFLMEPTVYIETSVISYLTARPNRNLRIAADQMAMRLWWRTSKHLFAVCISRLVLDEASAGDVEAAKRRMSILDGLPLLELTPAVSTLCQRILDVTHLPGSARIDAAHIAAAAVNGIDFLLTWNCNHINNAAMKPMIRKLCVSMNLNCPEICTPRELSGGGL
jgi:predicted nucleic acid-binding protein